MQIATVAIALCIMFSVITLAERAWSQPFPGVQPPNCPPRCRCVTVSGRRHPASRMLQQYAQMFDWREGAEAAVCWGRREVPTEILSEVTYLILVGDASRTGTAGHDASNSIETSQEPDDTRQLGIEQIQSGTFSNAARLAHLDMHGNGLTELLPGSFVGLENLEMLSLKDNGLRELPRDVLWDMRNLTGLFLSGNNLQFLPEDCFRRNTKLREVDLGSNLLESIPLGSLRGLSHIRLLDLSQNRLVHLPEELLVDLLDLRKLILDGNEIAELPGDFFLKNVNLEIVSLKNNKLEHLPGSIFYHQTNLLELDLSGNNLVELGDSIFPPVSALQNLDVSHNSLREVTMETFQNCNKLSTFTASSNKLSEITAKTFGELPSLSKLTLDCNNISVISPGSLQGLVNLESLDLTNNALHRLRANAFYGLKSLTSLRLDDNGISVIEPEAFSIGYSSMSKLTWLYLRRNNMKALEHGMFRGAPFVQMLNLADNQIASLPPSGLGDLRRLVTLSLHGNRIGSLQDGAFSRATGIDALDLSGNSLHRVDEGAFKGLHRLRELNMADNELDETTSDWVATLTSLTQLNLSGNRFAQVPPVLLTSLPDLSQLFLARNILDTFRIPDHDRSRGLSRLDVADNNLQTIEGGLSRIMASRSSVDLSGNPWLCDCGLVSDVIEMTSVGARFENEDGTKCETLGEVNDKQEGECPRVQYTYEEIILEELISAVQANEALCGLQQDSPAGQFPASPPLDESVRSGKAVTEETRCRRLAAVSKSDGTWPWYAVVWNSNTESPLCNAALIGNDWAVTTLRCLQQIQYNLSTSVPTIFGEIVRRERDSLLMAPPGLVVRLGKSKRMLDFEAAEQIHGVMNIYFPANDRGAGLDRPVLLQFSSLASLTKQVTPACITKNPVKVALAVALGWGVKHKATPPKEALQSSRMKFDPCHLSNDVIDDSMLCGAREKGMAIDYSIEGNMGGALVMKRGRGDWLLLGIGTRINQQGQDVFVDLSQYADWIDRKIAPPRSKN